jgi:hypothetical protein
MTKNGKRAAQTAGFEALMYQLLETELGGVEVYTQALECVVNPDLKEEWQKYLGETKRHVEIARSLLTNLGLDPDAEVAARAPVRLIGQSLVAAMKTARKNGTPEEAQLTAAECVVEAETKDHMNWELVGTLAEEAKGEQKKLLEAAYEEVEKEEDHHLYHSAGWARELWIEALGMPAVLPPPEEEKDVETAIGAARAKNAREEML